MLSKLSCLLLVLLNLSAYAETTATITVPTPSSETIPYWKEKPFSILASFTATASSGSYSESAGGGIGVSASYRLSPDFNVGAFFDSKATVTGLLSVYTANIGGVKGGYYLMNGEKTNIILNARAGYMSASGMEALFFIPYGGFTFNSFCFGPQLDVLFNLGPSFILGLNLSYLQVLKANATGSNIFSSDSSTTVPSFGIADAGIVLGLRI